MAGKRGGGFDQSGGRRSGNSPHDLGRASLFGPVSRQGKEKSQRPNRCQIHRELTQKGDFDEWQGQGKSCVEDGAKITGTKFKRKKREEREEKGFYLWREGKWGRDMGDLGGHLVCWSHNRTLFKMITAYWSGAKSP